MTDFLPTDYEAPKTGGAYMKLQKGENRFRIMSKPILGWLDWKDNQPHRFRMNEKPTAPFDPSRAVKHFWAFIVWNCNEQQIQILEITQSGIQQAIAALSKDPDWGAPFGYDIKVTRSGEGLDTEYTVSPVPHKPRPDEAVEASNKRPIYLEALYDGADPFADHGTITPIENAIPF